MHLSDGKGCQKSDKVNSIDTKKELATLASISHELSAKVGLISDQGYLRGSLRGAPFYCRNLV